jgi:hypothetical protein
MAKHGKPSPVSPKLDGPGASTGSDYPSEYFTNPWNAGIDRQRGQGEDNKTLRSPTLTTEGPGVPLNHGYDELWKGK